MESQQGKDGQEKPLWQRVDDRFFWNKHMLHDIINLNVSNLYKIDISIVKFRNYITKDLLISIDIQLLQ